MIDVLIAEENKRFTQFVSNMLRHLEVKALVTHEMGADEIKGALREHPSSVMILGPSWAQRTALVEVARVCAAFPNVTPILIADSLSTELLREAMRAGIKDVLPRAMDDDELSAAISRGDEISRSIQHIAPLERAQALTGQESDAPFARTLIIMGAKGGVGKSVIATNLAVCLANSGRKKVALLDLDLRYGDVAVMLQLVPRRTIYDVVDDIDRLDSDLMQGFITEHDSGVGVLASPLDPLLAERIKAPNVRKIIRTLKTMVDYIVIDAPTTIDEKVEVALRESDEAFVVTSMDVPSIKDAKLLLRLLGKTGDRPKPPDVHLIVNRSDSRVGLDKEHLVTELETEIFTAIPSCRQVPMSMNRGSPLVLEFPRSPAGKALFTLAKRVVAISESNRNQEREANLVEVNKR